MSETLNLLTLTLGIIGTVTGILAIGFSYLNYNFQKPNLNVKVKNCRHYYQKELVFFEIRFNQSLEIKNKGDRGTTISKIEFSFADFGKTHFLEYSTHRKQRERFDELGEKSKETEFRRIHPAETIVLDLGFSVCSNSSFIHREKINCILTIFTTRKNYKVKFTSINKASFD
jgi:hypothetical protein